MSNFTHLTEQHINSLYLESRKKLGQYMTPSSIGNIMTKMLDIDASDSPMVLDPACGTGELLLSVKRVCPNAKLYGFDIDDRMVKTASENVAKSNIKKLSIFDENSLKEHGKYDYIIGNPPYFEMKKDNPDLKSASIASFASLNDKGRLNIYALFVEYAMRLTKIGGKVSFLVPPSMNNGAYFKELRQRVLELGTIEDIYMIRENGSFDDALTSVQILLLKRTDAGFEQNLQDSSEFVLSIDNNIIFTDKKHVIEKFSAGKKSIRELGFDVKTGSVTWNQYKNDFHQGQIEEQATKQSLPRTDGKHEHGTKEQTVVIFAKDIAKTHDIILTDKISAPGHWIDKDKVRTVEGPAIVVNRIVGSLDNPNLRFALVEQEMFCGENHVNVITRKDGDDTKVRQLYEALLTIEPSELSVYLQAVTGNTQLSSVELGNMPVKL